MKRQSFLSLLCASPKGTRIVYHTGSLMYDRVTGPDFQQVHATACEARETYEQGVCLLMQHKVAPLQYEYIAQKR